MAFEIIKDGINGFLVKLGDQLSFSKSIMKIISNKDLSKRFSKNIREDAEKLLSPEKIYRIEIDCFKKIKNYIKIMIIGVNCCDLSDKTGGEKLD